MGFIPYGCSALCSEAESAIQTLRTLLGLVSLATLLSVWRVWGQCAGGLLTACLSVCLSLTCCSSPPCFSHCSFVIEMLKSLPSDEGRRDRQARSIWFLDALIRFRAQKVIKGKSKPLPAPRHFILVLSTGSLSVVLSSPHGCLSGPPSSLPFLQSLEGLSSLYFLLLFWKWGRGDGAPESTFPASVLLGKTQYPGQTR